MNTTQARRGHTVRELPAGHSDTESAFHVPEQLRTDYETVTVSPEAQAAAIEQQQDANMRAEVLSRLETVRARKESAMSPPEYRSWIRKSFRDGFPTNWVLSSGHDIWPTSPDNQRIMRRPLPPDEEALVLHRTTLATARDAYKRRLDLDLLEKQRPEREAAREQRRLERVTCQVCHIEDEDTALQPQLSGGRDAVRMCPSCADLMPVFTAALATTPGGTSRADCIAAWLAPRGSQDSSPASQAETSTRGPLGRRRKHRAS